MSRILLSEVFPFLLPLRIKQKKLFFYNELEHDDNTYASIINQEKLGYCAYHNKSLLINENSGADIKYQYNKVHNLKICSKTMNKILIKPNETFSFWWLAKNHKQYGEYKPGLNLIKGKLSEVEGGGLCQLSNLLYDLFLHSPLDIVERKAHDSVSIAPTNSLLGVDATLNEGWIDLKVKNRTPYTFQVNLSFDEDYIYGSLNVDTDLKVKYEIYNSKNEVVKNDGLYFHSYTLNRRLVHNDRTISDDILYSELKRIDYKHKYLFEAKEQLNNV
ncbi:MAG: VanW family protein [Erysipelotrichales bacterium]